MTEPAAGRGSGRRVLIVDDHDGFRVAVRDLIDEAGFTVVGEAVDGAAAVLAAEHLRPDVVLLDIQLPTVGGFEVAELLAAQIPPPAVILVSGRDARTYGARLATAPSVGFLRKEEISGPALLRLLE